MKQSTNTCMVYAETGCYPLSINTKVKMVKQWLRIVCSDQRKLIWIAYDNMVNATKPLNMGSSNKTFALQHRLWICMGATIS